MTKIEGLIIRAHKSAAQLRGVSEQQIKAALRMLADLLEKECAGLLRANAKDLAPAVS